MHSKLFLFSRTKDATGVLRDNVSWFGSANLTYATGANSYNNTVTVYGDKGEKMTDFQVALTGAAVLLISDDLDEVLAFNQAPCTRLQRRGTRIGPRTKREWSTIPLVLPALIAASPPPRN